MLFRLPLRSTKPANEQLKMANMSKMTQMESQEEEEDLECCVCFEQKKFKPVHSYVVFNGLTCERHHKVCFHCVSKLLKTCDDEECKCLGYNWKCPLCREVLGIGRASQLIGVISGSWKKVREISLRRLQNE